MSSAPICLVLILTISVLIGPHALAQNQRDRPTTEDRAPSHQRREDRQEARGDLHDLELLQRFTDQHARAVALDDRPTLVAIDRRVQILLAAEREQDPKDRYIQIERRWKRLSDRGDLADHGLLLLELERLARAEIHDERRNTDEKPGSREDR